MTTLSNPSVRSVLLIGNFLSAAGGSRGVCEDLAIGLEQLGWRVFTASHRRSRVVRLVDMVRAAFKWRAGYSVAQVEVFSGPAFCWAETMVGVLGWLGKPCVLSLHGGRLPEFAARWPGRVRRLLSRGRVVTAPSGYLRETLAPYCPGIRIIPNPVELARYPFRERGSARPRLVWLRAFHDIYNPVLAARVAALLAPATPQLELVMAGPDKRDGSLARTMAEVQAAGLGSRVRFPGQVPKLEVPRLLAESDVFLNTSRVDNTPVSLIEAMACGLCVVSTKVGGIPHLVTHGRDALLVPPDNAPEMARAVQTILADPARAAALSRAARATAQACDSARVYSAWNQLLAEVGEFTASAA